MYQKNSSKGNGFTFRCFNRKGYALFAALGREVKVGVLTVATLSTAAPCLAAVGAVSTADVHHTMHNDSIATLDDDQLLREAVSAASRAPLAADLAARQVTTLGHAQLAAAGVTSINDVLKLSAGIDVRERGGFGLHTDIGINGGTFDQITILVNGIPINNPQTGHNAADFPLNLSDIERIEVLEGAASRVLGTQAFSGAINIVTHTADRGVQLRAAAGSWGTVQTEARGAWQRTTTDGRRFRSSLSGSFQRSDGAVDNGDFRGGKAFWQGGYEDASVRVDAQAGMTLNDFGANTFYSAAYPNQWEALHRYTFALKGESKGRIHFTPQLSWTRSADHFQLIRNTHTAENFHRSDVFTLGLNAWTQWALGRTAVGAELREEGVHSTNLGHALTQDEWVVIPGKHPVERGGKWEDRDGGAAYYNKQVRRTNLSYFLEHNIVLNRWTLSLGLLAQRCTPIDSDFRLYPGIDVAFRPADRLRLFASWNQALRLPTFTDRFYNTPTHEGSNQLRPEEVDAFRLGFQWTPTSGLRLRANGFFHRGKNMIDWVKTAATDTKYKAVNWLRLDNYGTHLTADLDGTALFGPHQPLRLLSIDYAWSAQYRNDTRPIFKSAYALEYLRHKLTLTLDHSIWQHLGASWSFRLQERNGTYEVFDHTTHKRTGATAPYGTHGRLDVKVHWTAARYSLFFDLHNLTGHRFYDIGNVEQPGRIFLVGGTLRF